MTDMSNYLETASYDFWFRPGAAAPTRPTSHTVSLWSAVTDQEAGTGTELTNITAPGYARAAVVFGASVNGIGSNTALVAFPTNSSGASWPAATFYGVHDHLGNLLQRLVALPAPIIVPAGQHATIQIGGLILTFD